MPIDRLQANQGAYGRYLHSFYTHLSSFVIGTHSLNSLYSSKHIPSSAKYCQ